MGDEAVRILLRAPGRERCRGRLWAAVISWHATRPGREGTPALEALGVMAVADAQAARELRAEIIAEMADRLAAMDDWGR